MSLMFAQWFLTIVQYVSSFWINNAFKVSVIFPIHN